MRKPSVVSSVKDILSPRLSAGPTESFGSLALTWQQLAGRLNGADVEGFRAFVLEGKRMPKDLANRVGEAVMAWALSHGVTHFAHWFHPLSGVPGEKHDAFLSLSYGADGATAAIDKLPGSLLLQGEPDASSFPNGNLRATHSARGYTVWDPTSPLFIRTGGDAPTLVVPCAYISYTGHALDFKTPLLRAVSALSREGTRYLNLVLGDGAVKSLDATLGVEQEYFLIDRKHLAKRPDLVMASRTLLGKLPSRNQQLEDHYFGPMSDRVLAFMAEAEAELYRLGVPAKSRHCEVAPSQYEIAPVFEQVNVACDHNVLTMDVLKRVANRHGMACLLHEKPFAGVNGSGKHNNWSMATDAGDNLLDPGATPAERRRFLAVLAAVLVAVHRHAAVLRVTVASAGNDHRLGANEAPPPIVSAYLGEAVAAMADAAERGEIAEIDAAKLLAVTERLSVNLDSTDRNRTASFAFTGNKFEFRAVGSSENCAWPMTVLNAAVADAFRLLGDRLEAKLSQGTDRDAAVVELVKEALTEAKASRFEGNGYAPEWVEEAKRRGLPVLRNTPAALPVLKDAEATAFLVAHGVLSEDELQARFVIGAERYLKAVDIEAATLADIATTRVLPAVEAQLATSGQAAKVADKAGLDEMPHLRGRLARLASLADALAGAADALEHAREGLFEGHDADRGLAHATAAVLPALAELRSRCDEAEGLVTTSLWPMPTYWEMLFPTA
jgi:glutamine synthetase